MSSAPKDELSELLHSSHFSSLLRFFVDYRQRTAAAGDPGSLVDWRNIYDEDEMELNEYYYTISI